MPEQTIKETAWFSARAMALAIDFALLGAVHIAIFIILAGRLLHEMIPLGLWSILTLCILYGGFFLVSFVFLHLFYFTLLHAWSGQTIGKMILGLRVVTQDNLPVSPAVAFLRWAGYLLSFVPLASGFLWSVVDRDHCAWHDRLARTRVISAEMT